MGRFLLYGVIGLLSAGLIAGCGTTSSGSSSPPSNITTGNQTSVASTTPSDNQTSSSQATGNNLSDITVPTGTMIYVLSPVNNETVSPGSKLGIRGKVANGFANNPLRITLFSGTQKVSKILNQQSLTISSDNTFSGTFTIPNHLPPTGTHLDLTFEILVKGGPLEQITLISKDN